MPACLNEWTIARPAAGDYLRKTMEGLRRIAAVLAGLALAVAGCGGDGGPSGDAGDRVAVDTRTPSPWRPGGDLDRVARTRAVARQAARRRAALAALEDVHTVPAALRRALLRGAIRPGEYLRHRAAYDGARKAARRLDGRARQPRSARCSPRCSDWRRTTGWTRAASAAVFLNLRRNTRTWTLESFPRARRAA